jgi:hypothetical protein
MKWLRPLLLASCLLVLAAPAFAAVAQTITVDGVNDFDPSNLIRDDRYDTQRFYCSPDSVFPLDIGRVYLTNDNNYIYFGFDWPHKWGCYDNSPGPNLGIAIDVNTAAGGSADPFNRKIGWTNLANRPDFVIYDVPSVPGNTYHYQILYKWTGTAWADSTRLVTGSGAGPYALGMVDTSGFVEVKIPLTAFGVTAGAHLNVEWWYTQDGTSKGPLDAVMSSGVQMSLFPSHTSWDTTAVVQMTTMAPYEVLAYSDAVPPTVSQAVATGFTLNASKQFVLTTNKIDVTFSEPVAVATANVAGNYAFSGPVSRTVILASRDASATNVVHLVLNSAISANAAFDNITVKNVKDLAGNTIVENGSTNVGSFFIQDLVFNVDPGVALCRGTFTPADTFSVEGSLAPLTFETLCDNALMYDGDANLVWDATVPFAMPKNAVTGKAEAELEYKYVHQCRDYDGGANRVYHLSSDDGASVTLSDYWNRENPVDFTAHPVDVIFQVNAALAAPAPADTFYLQGDETPLSFTPSGIAMKDDGVSPDLVAGDMIYTARARFPKCAKKAVEWKIFYRGAFECLGQGNRTVWVNDAAYDTVGGAMGPIWLPARGIQRCTVTDKPITVVFKVYMGPAVPLPGLADTVAVMGDAAPLSFDAPPPPAAWMNDAKSGYDGAAGDRVWTVGVTFPDSTQTYVHYKYWYDGVFECFGMDNRYVALDDLHYSATVPMRPEQGLWDYCSSPVGVEPAPVAAGTDFAVLRQGFPNPMSPRTTIRFELRRAGEVKLSIYDVTGRKVNTLLDRTLGPGPYEVQWDGRDADGRLLRSGVYLYDLSMGKDRLSRRIVLAR